MAKSKLPHPGEGLFSWIRLRAFSEYSGIRLWLSKSEWESAAEEVRELAKQYLQAKPNTSAESLPQVFWRKPLVAHESAGKKSALSACSRPLRRLFSKPFYLASADVFGSVLWQSEGGGTLCLWRHNIFDPSYKGSRIGYSADAPPIAADAFKSLTHKGFSRVTALDASVIHMLAYTRTDRAGSPNPRSNYDVWPDHGKMPVRTGSKRKRIADRPCMPLTTFADLHGFLAEGPVLQAWNRRVWLIVAPGRMVYCYKKSVG